MIENSGAATYPQLLDIDARIGRHPQKDVGEGSAAELVEELSWAGIQQAIVSHAASWLHDPALGNRWIVDATSDHPGLHPSWVVLPDICGEVEAPLDFVRSAERGGVVAARAYPLDHGYDLSGPDMAPLWDVLADARMPLLIDAGQADWRSVEAVAAPRPSLTVVVCKPGYRTLRRIAGVLGRVPNVHVGLGGLATHCGLEWLVASHGSSRILFGSGMPDHDPGEAVTRLLLSELAVEDIAAIGQRNAIGLIGERTGAS